LHREALLLHVHVETHRFEAESLSLEFLIFRADSPQLAFVDDVLLEHPIFLHALFDPFAKVARAFLFGEVLRAGGPHLRRDGLKRLNRRTDEVERLPG